MRAAADENHRCAEPPPGPPPLNSLYRKVRHYAPFFVDPLGTVEARFRRYGDVYRVTGQGAELLLIRDPDIAREVLIAQGAIFGKQHSAFGRLRQVLGDGLLTSEGEVWRRQRTLLQPVFARPRLRDYSEVMVDMASRAVAGWSPGSRVSLTECMTQITLRIVARTLFGVSIDTAPRVTHAIDYLNRVFSRPDFLPAGVPTLTRRRAAQALRDLDAAVLELIELGRQQLAGGHAARVDLLRRLLEVRDETGQALSHREIRDQLVTFYLAGHETTANALSWTFYLLSRYPQVRDRLQTEVRDRLGARLPTLEDLEQLPYLNQVLCEALRLYPPAPAIPRAATQDTQLGPYPVAAGTEVVVWSTLMHRLARYYPDPERFEPERFAPAQREAIPRCAYLPFGAGQRACIGQHFATIEAQLILATLVQRVQFDLVSTRPVKPRPGVTLRPDSDLRATVRFL